MGVRLPGRRRRLDLRLHAEQRRGTGRHQRADGDPHQHQRADPRHEPRRHPLVLGAAPQRQARHGAGPRPHVAVPSRGSPASTPASAPSSAGSATPTCAWRSSPSTRPTSRSGSTTSSSRTRIPTKARSPPTGEATFIAHCSRCHQVDGLTNADGDPVISAPDQWVYAGAAPNLTNLMTRNTFAGASWDLLTEDCRDGGVGRVARRVRRRLPRGRHAGVPQPDRPAGSGCGTRRPRSRCTPIPTSSRPTDGKFRGMPNLGLSEDQIDQLVAYLLERK